MTLMRREWSGIIKNRQWADFESLAKSEPSQALADTVAELERGLSEKADRRALRKVLYILSQAGYRPQEIPETEPESAEAAAPFELGCMASADTKGIALFAYGVERQGRVRCLIAGTQSDVGVVDAVDRALTLDEARDFGRKMFSNLQPGSIECPVPPGYALSRIAAGLREQKQRAPQAAAYWRATLEAAPTLPHPAEALQAAETTAEERRAVSYLLDAAMPWRLEMGSVMPMLEEIYRSQSSGVVLSDEQRRDRNESIFGKARSDLFTPEVVADHALRLRDLAYLLSIKKMPDAGLALSAALDLEKNAGDSDYARGLLDKTVALLLESWKQSAERRAPAMRRFQ